MISLVDFGASNPAIDRGAFPSAAPDIYWSGSTDTNNGVWIVRFDSGAVDAYEKAYTARGRCVRTEQVRSSLGAPPGRYRVEADIVEDLATGLTWQRAKSPTVYTAADADLACAVLELGGSSEWRVPSVKELASLVDERVVNPALDLDAFPGPSNGTTFYTATPAFGDPGQRWVVNLWSGGIGTDAVSEQYSVRCVRP